MGAGLQRARATVEALRYPWPPPHGSAWRLALLFLGPALAAAPTGLAARAVVARVALIELCAFSGFFATVLFNDIADRDLDRLAHPQRPLARGTVRVGDAVALCAALYLINLTTAWLLGAVLFALVALWLVVLVGLHYFVVKRGRAGKRLYSDLITPLQFAGFGVLVYLGFGRFQLSAMALLWGTIYCADAAMNLLQAIQDRAADAQHHVPTFAVRHGVRAAARLAVALFVVGLPLAALYGVVAGLPPLWTALVLSAGAVTVAVLVHVARRPEPARVARGVSATAFALQLTLASMAAAKLAPLVLRASREP